MFESSRKDWRKNYLRSSSSKDLNPRASGRQEHQSKGKDSREKSNEAENHTHAMDFGKDGDGDGGKKTGYHCRDYRCDS